MLQEQEKALNKLNRIQLSQGLESKFCDFFSGLISEGTMFDSVNELGRFVQSSELGGWLYHYYGDQSEKSQLSKLCGYLQRHFSYYVNRLVKGRSFNESTYETIYRQALNRGYKKYKN